MIFVNYLLSMVLLILFSACSVSPPHGVAGNNLINGFIKHAKKTQGLRMFGYGGAFLDDIKAFFFGFTSSKVLDLNESRQFLVFNVENLLEMVNSSTELAPYLHERPFTAKNIKMEILYQDSYGVISPKIAHILTEEGVISYCTYNPETDCLERVHSESYAKALGIVQHQVNMESLAEFPEYCQP